MRILLPAVLLLIAFWVYSIVDCALLPPTRHRGVSKPVWLLIVVLLVTTRPIAGGHYMYPIYPFNWHALRALLIRRPIAPDNT